MSADLGLVVLNEPLLELLADAPNHDLALRFNRLQNKMNHETKAGIDKATHSFAGDLGELGHLRFRQAFDSLH